MKSSNTRPRCSGRRGNYRAGRMSCDAIARGTCDVALTRGGSGGDAMSPASRPHPDDVNLSSDRGAVAVINIVGYRWMLRNC